MDTSASSQRLERLRTWMDEHDTNVFYVRDTSNIAWLTAFDGVFDAERAHALMVAHDCAVLHTDSRYANACRAAAGPGPVEVDDALDGEGRPKSHAAWLFERLDVLDAASSDSALSAAAPGDAGEGRISSAVALEGARGVATEGSSSVAIEDSINLGEYRKLEQARAESEGRVQSRDGGRTSSPAQRDFNETDGVIENLRAVKDAIEIERLRAAQAITDAAFEHIVGFMKPGMTERHVQIELDGFMRMQGAQELAFPSIVATGANGANPHAQPGEAVLEQGQCVVMDFGAKLDGYCSDMTRTVFVGEPSARLRRAYEVLRQANEQVAAALRPGMTGRQAHEMALAILDEGGFGGLMGHGLGHGVGLDIHEQPVLSLRNGDALETGNVVTVEPGIYLPGEFGMRLEDCGVVTDEGFDVFGQSTHDLVII